MSETVRNISVGPQCICRNQRAWPHVCGILFSCSLPVKLAVISRLELNKCMCTLKNPRISNSKPPLNFLSFYRNFRTTLWLKNLLFCQSRVMDTHAPITLGIPGGFKPQRFKSPLTPKVRESGTLVPKTWL
jgi:hypothetical protein